MQNAITLVSVNRSKREKIRIGRKVIETGIFKTPVKDRIEVTYQGLQDDTIVNRKYHGGSDQAVYLYTMEDYEWWAEKLQKPLLPGTFGENLTFSAFGTPSLRIGDRFRINEVLLEVTSVRIPCATFAARMNDPGFVKKFRQAQRPGAYARVLHPGMIQAGDEVIFIPGSEDYPTIVEIFELWFSKMPDPSLIKRALQAPLAERLRVKLQP